jgi:DoxX-like family
MNKTNILYWVFTGLFAAFMMFSAVPNILLTPDSVAFIGRLGFPNHFIQFIGIAKALGVIAILVPGFARIKEWAYAGLFFDLIGAVYAMIAVDGFQPGIFGMLLPFVIGGLSYYFHHKRLTVSVATA